MQTFNIPSGINTITKLSAVTPGVCNITLPDDIDKFINNIVEELKNPDEYKKLVNEPVVYLKLLADLYKSIEEETVKETINDKNPDYDPKIRDDYYYHRNKSYNVTQYKTNEPIINKMYFRNNKTELNTSAWDYQISVLNVVGVPDLLREIKRIRTYQDTESSITLKEIVDFLKTKGVENIVLLDFSCSNFEPEPNERVTRNVRLTARKEGLNGGKKITKTKRLKTKSKYKNRKKRKSKKYYHRKNKTFLF
jgi:hypothetical protein